MDTTISRRTLLGAFTAAMALGTLHSVAGAPGARAAGAGAPGDVFDELRLRYRATLVGPPDLDLSDPVIANEAAELAAEVDEILALLDRRADRPGVFHDRPIVGATDASVVTDTFKRLLPLATAWAVPGHRWSGSEELAADLVAGMRTVNELAYAAGKPEWENWWDWELGSPSRIGKILVIAHDVIPADLRQAYVDAVAWFATPGYMYQPHDARHKPATGSNLLNICLGAAINAIVGRQADRLDQVMEHAPLGLGFNDGTSGTADGFHPDGSFLQHDSIAYTGTYGSSLLGAIGDVVGLLGGSPWEITSPGMEQILQTVDRTFAPVIFDGLMMDFVSGREIAYSERTEATRGRGAVLNVIQLSYGAGDERRGRWLAMARGWIERSAYLDLSNPSSIGAVPALAAALDPSVPAAPEPAEAVVFPRTERFVHRRPGWAVSMSTNSERIARFEVTNHENKKPWHQGSGQLATYLSGDVDGQRSDGGYWATLDPYRIPGTTVDSAEQATITDRSFKGAGSGGTAFSVVGGPLDDGGRQRGRYGAAFSEETGFRSTMRVNQSWFLVDDGVICLGTGIRGGSAAVETVVENRRVPVGSNSPWTVDGRTLPGSGSAGFAAQLRRPAHAALDGVGGYVFLERPEALHLLREDREGTWRAIKESEGPEIVRRSYATAWIDHGTDPVGGSYAYVLLPGADAARTSRFAGSHGIEVAANTALVQAVQVEDAGYLGANFTAAGSVTVGRYTITVSGPASVSLLVSMGREKSLEVAVSDATRAAAALDVTVTLPTGQKTWAVRHTDRSVMPTVAGGTLSLAVAPGGTGNSHRAVAATR